MMTREEFNFFLSQEMTGLIAETTKLIGRTNEVVNEINFFLENHHYDSFNSIESILKTEFETIAQVHGQLHHEIKCLNKDIKHLNRHVNKDKVDC